MGFISVFGSDPVPGIALFGNANVRFESFGGDEDPMAAVFHDKGTGVTENVSTQNKAEIFKAFHRSG